MSVLPSGFFFLCVSAISLKMKWFYKGASSRRVCLSPFKCSVQCTVRLRVAFLSFVACHYKVCVHFNLFFFWSSFFPCGIFPITLYPFLTCLFTKSTVRPFVFPCCFFSKIAGEIKKKLGWEAVKQPLRTAGRTMDGHMDQRTHRGGVSTIHLFS